MSQDMSDNVTDRAGNPATVHKHDHERSDVAPRWPIFVGIGMLLSLPVTIALIAALLYTIWSPPHRPAGNPQVTFAAPASNAPRLQTNPQAELAALRKQWDKQLHSIGWVDREQKIVHVPIAQAEQRLLKNGLPTDTRKPPPSRAGPRSGNKAGGNDQAGNAAARPARNNPQRTPTVPYRKDRMPR